MPFFKPAARYPADPRAVFVLALCVLVGIPLVFGNVEPNSLEALLPSWIIVAWGSILSIGAGVTLVGISRQTIGGAILEQVGSAAVGIASLFYGIVVLLVAGTEGIVALAYITGFGLAMLWRWAQLQSYLHRTQMAVDEYHRTQES